jgi:hypothetical protein
MRTLEDVLRENEAQAKALRDCQRENELVRQNQNTLFTQNSLLKQKIRRLSEGWEAARIEGQALREKVEAQAESLRNCQSAKGGWTPLPPATGGLYWHWNGDEGCTPNPVFVSWSGTTGNCFVQGGQLGMERAMDCDKFGGWWIRLKAPALPPIPSAGTMPCPACLGSGTQNKSTFPHELSDQYQEPCEACEGTGRHENRPPFYGPPWSENSPYGPGFKGGP